MLLMVEKGISGGICHRHAKANNKYMKNHDKNEESSYWMQTIFMDSQCLKNCCFWIEKKKC